MRSPFASETRSGAWFQRSPSIPRESFRRARGTDLEALPFRLRVPRLRSRRALVDEGDYFAFLGVDREATGYQIRHAYLDLRSEFEPSRLLTAATADLRSDVDIILEVLDEGYEVLREPTRRERYRRALAADPQ